MTTLQRQSRTEKQPSQPDNRTKSMRGIRHPFSNQLFEPQDLLPLQQIEGINASAYAVLLWEFTENDFRTIMDVDAGQPSLGSGKVPKWLKEDLERKSQIVIRFIFLP